jgi:E3 ubiquitin-protein ligase HUWE1
MAKELERERAACKDEFIDSLFCFLSCLQLSVYAGSLLVGAGIVPVLVDICKNSHPNQIGTVIRAVTNLDGLLYGFTSAFALFNQVDGLKVFVNRIKEEVDKAIAEHHVDITSSSKPSELLIGMLSHSSAGLLKALFRSIQRLLTSAGTLESVRNLTETQLPLSIKLIIQNKAVFGYQIYSLAINMMSTLIHSEPTSLVILQETGLPEALYDAIDSGIEPAFDVIAAIPSALGALCLNEVGLQQLNERQAIPAIFAVFTSERHARILRDRDHASVVGSTIDELIRHQPSLKKTVLEATLTFLSEIDRIGKAVDVTASQVVNAQLKACVEESPQAAIEGASSSLPVAPSQSNLQDVVMNENQGVPSSVSNLFQSATASVSKKEKERDEKDHYSNNLVLLLIDVACRVSLNMALPSFLFPSFN